MNPKSHSSENICHASNLRGNEASLRNVKRVKTGKGKDAYS